MITKKEASEIAFNHINQMNINNPHSNIFKWISSDIEEYSNFYFSEYNYELMDKNNKMTLGGAPGFIINKKHGGISDISFSELIEIKKPNQ